VDEDLRHGIRDPVVLLVSSPAVMALASAAKAPFPDHRVG